MALVLQIGIPTTAYDTTLGNFLDADTLWNKSLIELRELVDVAMAQQRLGLSATNAQIRADLQNYGSWAAYTDDAARETAIGSRKTTLTTLRSVP